MIYHFLRGNTFHLSPQIMEGVLKQISRKEVGEKQKHFFCIMRFSTKYNYKTTEDPYEKIIKRYQVENVVNINSPIELFLFIRKIDAKKGQLIFHGTVQPYKLQIFLNIYLLLFYKKMLTASSLICWGSGDFHIEKSGAIGYIIRTLNSAVFKRMRASYLLSSEDLRLFKLLHPEAQSHSITYPLSTDANKPKRTSTPLRIMISHSGWPANKHLDAFKMLARFSELDIEIICPLCYGDPNYIRAVIEEGISIFGNKFSYFTEIMEIEDYKRLIGSMDIFISAAQIQTGLFAVTSAIASGAKIFMQGNLLISLHNDGFLVNDFQQIEKLDFSDFSKELTDAEYLKNIEALKRTFFNNDDIEEKWNAVYQQGE